MREDFNKQVFESFPDSVWAGEMPDLNRSTAGRRNSNGNSRNSNGNSRNSNGRNSNGHNNDNNTRIIKIARRITYVAAGLCIPFAAATILLATRKNEAPATTEPIAQAEIVYKVNNALQGNIVLPDSTVVTLNSGSTLRLAQDFGAGTRTVNLDGEAYFDVHKDRKVPFIINTPQGVEVKVTGTKFNMSCYSDSKEFDLTLIQGSVEVTTTKKETLYIQPSEEVIIRDDFFNVSKKEAPEQALVWTDGTLRFDRTSMREVIARIERWYGVDIVVEDEAIYRSSFSAEFHSETLNEVLQLLSITSRLSYSIDGDTVMLRPKK